MATLTANITADLTLIPLSAEVEIGYYSIDSENIYVTGMSRGADGREFTRRWASVDRGVGGSTPATHNSAATLTRYYPDAKAGTGGGGVTVDNTVDAPAEVTTIIAAGASIAGDEATLPLAVFARRVALTDAQIKALPTAPIELVPAPGASNTIMLVGAFIRIDASNDEYDNIDPTASLFITFAGESVGRAQGLYDNTNGGLESLLTSFSNMSVLLAPYTTVPAADTLPPEPALVDISDSTNKALVLAVENGALGAFTGGNAANNGSVTAVYTIVTL